MRHLRQLGTVPSDVRLQPALVLAFHGVCLLNITAMLLAMHLRRSGEISIIRALGASRRPFSVSWRRSMLGSRCRPPAVWPVSGCGSGR